MTLLEMMTLNLRPFDLPLLKMTLRRLLLALDFLHTEADIVHTGTAPLAPGTNTRLTWSRPEDRQFDA